MAGRGDARWDGIQVVLSVDVSLAESRQHRVGAPARIAELSRGWPDCRLRQSQQFHYSCLQGARATSPQAAAA